MPVIRLTTVVKWLLIFNVGFFLIQLFSDTFFGTSILEIFALVPAHVFQKATLWQFLTYMFFHADLFHILFNMLILWMIGSELEQQWGSRFFLKYYFICGLSGGFIYFFIQIFFKGTSTNYIPMMGSSGAIYGLLVAYGIIYSERLLLFMMIFPMKAKHFVLLLAAIEFISTVFYSRSGVANAAHLGGMVVGFSYLFIKAYLRVRKKRKPFTKKQSKERPSYLKLVVNNEVISEFDENDEEDNTYH